MSDLDDATARAAAEAARQLEEEATLGKLLWTDDAGGRCYYRLDGPKVNVLTIVRPGTGPLVHRFVGMDWGLL